MSIAPVPFFPVPPQPVYTTVYGRGGSCVLCVRYSDYKPCHSKTYTHRDPCISAQALDEVGTVYESNTVLRLKSATAANNTVGMPLPTYTVSTLPTVETGTLIYVSDGAAGSPVVAFGDGSNWLRVDTRAAVST